MRHPALRVTENNFWFQSLNFTDMSPTSFFKFFLTPYYSPSWDETSCSTSHCNYLNFLVKKWRKRFWAARPKKIWPDQIFNFFHFFTFFDLRWASFVRSFNPDKVYRRNIPSGWHIFHIKLYPKMKSNQNLNAWSYVNFWFQILKSIDLLPTSFFKFSLTPYYSPSWDETSCSTSQDI